jgi:small nuclear ribonucleoprotein G
MKGYDQYMNIVLDEAIEIVKASSGKDAPAESNRNLGMVVLRGASVQLWENLDKV